MGRAVKRRISIIGFVVVACLTLGIAWWRTNQVNHRDANALTQFTREFVSSVCSNTDFYKRYIRASDLPGLLDQRKHMTRDFEVVLYEDAGFPFGNDWQFGAKFSNGAHAYIDVFGDGPSANWVSMSEVADWKSFAKGAKPVGKACP